jgi:glycosyltransferase involved in cell wall biosynthesis
MRVCINARLVSGASGGVESVVMGMAHGLSALTDSDDEYLFLVHDDGHEWLASQLANGCRAVPSGHASSGIAARTRERLGTRYPKLRDARYAVRVQTLRRSPVRASDGVVERLRADVVHFPFQSGFLTSIPTVYQPHDLQHVHLPQNFSRMERGAREHTYRTLCNQAAAIAVGARWVRDDLLAHYEIAPERIHVIALAPTYELHADEGPEPAKSAEGERPFVLYPAQTWPHKNHIGLLQALALLRDKHDLTVPLIATGRKTEYFTQKIKPVIEELRLEGQVDFRGFVGTRELRSLHERARAVVVPTTFEAASFPIWDAFVSGVPIACSSVTSLPEQVGNGEAGILFDPHDPADIAAAVRRIWVDDALRAKLAANGKARVERLSWQETARRFRALYRLVANIQLDESDVALLAEEPLL